ncbi:Gip (predicted) [Pycnogonum litorale]
MKLASNLTLMFTECGDVCSRFKVAAEAGFKYVECVNPFESTLEEIVAAKRKTDVQMVHINSYPGPPGQFGFAAVPGKEDEFMSSLQKSVSYAKGLDCKRIHIMSGKRAVGEPTSLFESTYTENLKLAAEVLEKEDIIGLIEPINSTTIENYFMSDFTLAEKIVKMINSPYLRLQLDIFHLQLIAGNLTRNIKRYLPLTGHIQISQAPNRNEPDSPGEINYPYIFKLLETLGYDDYIGLEYKPTGKTLEGLRWVEDFGLSLS